MFLLLSWINVIKALGYHFSSFRAFWQIVQSKYTTTDDGICDYSILETFEMMYDSFLVSNYWHSCNFKFAFLHIEAFNYYKWCQLQPSSKSLPPSRTARWRSLGHGLDFRDMWIGCVYVVENVEGKEPTHDVKTKRTARYERGIWTTEASPRKRVYCCQPLQI